MLVSLYERIYFSDSFVKLPQVRSLANYPSVNSFSILPDRMSNSVLCACRSWEQLSSYNVIFTSVFPSSTRLQASMGYQLRTYFLLTFMTQHCAYHKKVINNSLLNDKWNRMPILFWKRKLISVKLGFRKNEKGRDVEFMSDLSWLLDLIEW